MPARESAPEEVPLAQKVIRKCHNPHSTPTNSPVASTPCPRCLSSVGTAKPVQPSASNKPPPTSPHPIPNRRSVTLSSDANMVGRNSGDVSESARSVAVTRRGAVRSATAYQRAPTRHLLILVRRLRKPSLP